MVLVLLLFLVVLLLRNDLSNGFAPSRPQKPKMYQQHYQPGLRVQAPLAERVVITAAPREDVLIEDVGVWDIADLVRLSTEQFKAQNIDDDDNGQDTLIGYIKLKLEIFRLFLPKIFFKDLMGHALIGLKKVDWGDGGGASGPITSGEGSITRKRLIGFVDVSLQRSDGSLEALKPFTMEQRRSMCPADTLEPYLCNLLVEPQCRGRGYGQLLIASCEQQAVQWGRRKLFLHVDVTTKALQLYLKTGFKPIKNLPEYKVMFLGKDL